MPNLWTTTYQKICETFSGPRTIDIEFDAKIEEMKNLEKSLYQIKAMFPNFPRNTQGIKYMCRDILLSLSVLFNEGNPYYPVVKDILDVHKNIDLLYDEMALNITGLSKYTQEWEKLFDEAKTNLSQRDTFRRIYEHYDEKFEKLVRIRNEKAHKNIPEMSKETERFDRNENKYKKASEDYIKISGYTFNLICDLVEFRNSVINPLYVEYIKEERKFFIAVADLFKKFDKLQTVIGNIERQYKRPVNTYNPVKYIRGGKLLENERINFDKPKIDPKISNIDPNKTNFTYEDYKNALKDNSNITPSVVEEKKQADPYSYDGYLQQRNVKVDTSGGNTDYVMDSLNRPKSKTVNYLNFDVGGNQSVPTNEPQKPSHEDVYNPYSQLSFHDIKPVFSGINNVNKNFHNPYEQKPTNFGNTNVIQPNNFSQMNNNLSQVNNNISNLNNNFSQVNNNVSKLNNTFSQVNNNVSKLNNQFDTINMSTSVYDMNFPTAPQNTYKNNNDGGFPR